MAMPKTTETRCRDGSVQARHVWECAHRGEGGMGMCTQRVLISAESQLGGEFIWPPVFEV